MNAERQTSVGLKGNLGSPHSEADLRGAQGTPGKDVNFHIAQNVREIGIKVRLVSAEETVQ